MKLEVGDKYNTMKKIKLDHGLKTNREGGLS